MLIGGYRYCFRHYVNRRHMSHHCYVIRHYMNCLHCKSYHCYVSYCCKSCHCYMNCCYVSYFRYCMSCYASYYLTNRLNSCPNDSKMSCDLSKMRNYAYCWGDYTKS